MNLLAKLIRDDDGNPKAYTINNENERGTNSLEEIEEKCSE
jgi:hypothetical protein